ncbi:hypothetical protein EYF80_036868 [Liparis tanakae]|uniref:Uncharacterized protein n=1 Tax=Liparis tanakae TaxID=230148 RepID=A0A4Z2GHY4_9TELE|nr:hypothetical protein EYF80_036868 [Liparis tanakae]
MTHHCLLWRGRGGGRTACHCHQHQDRHALEKTERVRETARVSEREAEVKTVVSGTERRGERQWMETDRNI